MTPNENDPVTQSLSALGISFADASDTIARVMANINSYQSNPKEFLESIEQRLEDERWRTDPMGLMPWFDPSEWRWLIADMLRSAADWIET